MTVSLRASGRAAPSLTTFGVSLCFTMATLAAPPAQARDGLGAALGIGLGAAVLGIAASQAVAQQPRYRVVEPRYYVVRQRRPAQPGEAVSSLQRALIALGFYTGDITGKLDKPTLLAIGSFQSRIGDKPTGKLTALQRQVLFANYAQSVKIAPAPSTPGQPAPGATGLLAAISAQNATPAAGPAVAVKDAPALAERPRFFRSVCREDADSEAAASPAVLTAGSLKLTPDQFCVGRAAALADASETLSKSGQSDVAQVRAGCRTFADGMKSNVSALLTTPAVTIAQRLQKEYGSAKGEAAANNYKICLGIGYADDQPDMVLASSLGLVGIGQAGYAELIGGVMGAGVSPWDQRPRSAEWLDFSAAQIEKGAPSVVRDLGADRAGVLKLAAKEMRAEPTRLAVAVLQTPAPAVVTEKAPSVTQASASATAAPASADPREALTAQARAFFAKEAQDQTVKLEALSSVLGLSRAEIGDRCRAFVAPGAAPDATKGLDPSMALRLCRTWSYANADGARMYVLDRRLADAGDADAASRLPLHMIAGNDKAEPKLN